MLDHGFTYELPDQNAPIIKVIGVGGGGSNAVQHMVAMGVKDVEFAICNTDRQALMSSNVKTKLKLGTGLEGAGMDVEVGRKAATESLDELRNLLGGYLSRRGWAAARARARHPSWLNSPAKWACLP